MIKISEVKKLVYTVWCVNILMCTALETEEIETADAVWSGRSFRLSGEQSQGLSHVVSPKCFPLALPLGQVMGIGACRWGGPSLCTGMGQDLLPLSSAEVLFS